MCAKVEYKIIRFYSDPDEPSHVVKTGLTWEEARDHCNDPSTRGEGWFDGYDLDVVHFSTSYPELCSALGVVEADNLVEKVLGFRRTGKAIVAVSSD
jgi:hypothetical protein